jgi:hypothetical protein
MKLGMLAIVLSLCACYSGGVKVTEQQVKKFEVGKSTYTDVVKDLGPPTGVTAKSDGTRTASYIYSMAKAKAASFIPVVGLFAGGADVRTTTTMFRFDAGGILLDYTTGDTSLAAGAGATGRATPREGEDAQPVSPAPLLSTCSDAGASRCNGAAVESCNGSAWSRSETCAAGQECSESKLYCPGGACCH